jgi:hypothetical protein
VAESSWRTRLLRRDGQVPELVNERVIRSLKAYITGSSGAMDPGSLIGVLAVSDGEQPSYVRDARVQSLYRSLDESLVVTHGFSMRAVFNRRVSREDLFDFLEYLDRQLLGINADPDFAARAVVHYRNFVDDLLQRENQPFRFVDGRVRAGLDRLQLDVVEGLAALAEDSKLRSDLTAAVDRFLDPKRRDREGGLLFMARAFDAAKVTLGSDPKSTFSELRRRALELPALGGGDAVGQAWDAHFDGLNALAQMLIRHGREDRTPVRRVEALDYLFFELANAVRLILQSSKN